MKPVLHQLKTDGRPLDGMSYVIECGDGRLVVIDGGMLNDVETLYAYLKRLSPHGIPVVAAWFITHVHADHTFALIGMGEKHPSDLRVERVICRYPTREFIQKTEPVIENELVRLDRAVDNFGNVERIVPNAGEWYTFGQVSFEILFTCADLPADAPAVINDTSTVFRMHFGGQTLLFLGDAEAAADRVMIDRYGAKLKSDAVQLAHHGCNGSTSEFYSLVDADFVFWPVKASYPSLGIYQFAPNRTVLGNGHIRDVYIAGYGHRAKPLPLEPDYAPMVFPVPDIHRVPTPQRTMGMAFRIPSLTDPSDPAWEQAAELDACGDYEGKRNGAYGRLRVLWTREALYLKASFYSSYLVSDPEAHLVDRCNNFRIHLVEEPVCDMTRIWDSVSGPDYLRGVLLYPEKKRFPEGEGYNTRPDRCESYGYSFEDHTDICARISFSRKHEKGDLIGFHAELNAVAEKGGARTLRMTLADGGQSLMYRFTPAGMLYWELI